MWSGLLAGLLALAAAGCRIQTPRFAAEILPLRLGETEVLLAVHSTDRPRPAFLVLHENERTAVEAGLEAIRARGGRLVAVQAQGERLVAFELGGETWWFDSNRVFTETGAQATLLAQNGSAPAEVLAEVRRFAEAVLEVYEAGSLDLLITLHNNTEDRYSAASYAPGGDLAEDAAGVHLPPEADPDDFFFVTDRRLYDALVPEGFPVVLQDNARVTDDGSLSVWAGQRDLPYVNVEAQHGHREAQIRMLEALARALDQLPAPE
jgi:hypothetical protein